MDFERKGAQVPGPESEEGEPQGEFAECELESGTRGIFKTGAEFLAPYTYENGDAIQVGDTIALNDKTLSELGFNPNRRFEVVGVAPEYRAWHADKQGEVRDFNNATIATPKLVLWVKDPETGKAAVAEKELLERSFKWQ